MAASASLWADGTEVLLPGADGDAWVRGAVVGGASGGAVAGQELRVRLQDGGEVVSVASASVTAANPAELERTDDLASLPVKELRARCKARGLNAVVPRGSPAKETLLERLRAS